MRSVRNAHAGTRVVGGYNANVAHEYDGIDFKCVVLYEMTLYSKLLRTLSGVI